MRLAIITSLYRSDTHLPSFLRKAAQVHRSLNDDGVTFEHLLIINDPTSLEAKLTESLSSPFRVIKVPRESIYDTWNRGIQESSASIFCFWNVDDYRFASAVKQGVTQIEKGVDAVFFPFIYLRFIRLLGIKILIKVKIFFPPSYKTSLFRRKMHAGPHFMVHRRAFEKNGYFDGSFLIAGDFDWWSRFAHTDLVARRINKISGIFTNDGTTLSGSRNARQSEENERIVNRAKV